MTATKEISDFCVRYSPDLAQCLKELERSKLNSVLDRRRILSVLELVKLAASNSDGEVIEMGVYRGGNAAAAGWMLRRIGRERTVHLFDTFQGMPASGELDTHEEFDFSDTSTDLVAEVLDRVVPGFPFRFHPGLFSETLQEVGQHRFCFAHLDAGLHQSVKEACEFAYPRMDAGGIMLFDDYAAPSCPGAMRAVDEFFRDKLEKPTLVSGCAYAIRKGAGSVDFAALISNRSLRASIVSATYRAPTRLARRTMARATNALISPQATRIWSKALVHSEGKHDQNGCVASAIRDAKNILVIRQDSIGDLVLMSPFLRELRQSNPAAQITLVVDSRLLNLVELCPHVNRVLSEEQSFCGATVNIGRVLEALRFSRSNLRASQFDLALIPRWDADLYHSAYLAAFSGAKRRVAFSEHVLASKSGLNRGFDGLSTNTIDNRAPKHELERNLDLLRFAGGTIKNSQLELWLSDEDRRTVRWMLELNGVSENDLVVALGVGAAHRRRRWPLARFVELGRFLKAKYGATVVAVGGPEDSQFGERIKSAIPCAVNFCGSLSLRQTGALLEHAQLTIANDSGPMHLAAAAGSAVVEISCHAKGEGANHENSPVRFKPWTNDSIVLQPEASMEPCRSGCEQNHAHCILRVTAGEAKIAAEALLQPRLNRSRVDTRGEVLLSRVQAATAFTE